MFKDLFSLKGRIALVTGGSRGIGKMIAAGFLAQGAAKVYITARKAGPCEATAKELTAAYDGECIALPIDISTVAGCEKLATEINPPRAEARHSRQQRGCCVGRRFRRIPRERLGQGDGPQRQVAVLSDQGAGEPLRAAASITAGQGHQHRLDRRHLRQPDGDLFLCRQQVRGDPSDAPHGRQTDQGPYQRHRHCAGRVQIGHEQGGA